MSHNGEICNKNLSQLSKNEKIVVSGMSGRFPNCDNVKEYLENLFKKIDLCDENIRGLNINHPEIPKLGGRLKSFNTFDIGYFGVHGYEAMYLDPMGRIFLEQVMQALFDAGIHPDEIAGTRTGVFIGSCTSEYEVLYHSTTSSNTGLMTGAMKSVIANRVSYYLKLNGPSMNCDTACSSSLYALDEAYRSIISGKCDMAIVGGTNLSIDQYRTLQFVRLGVINSGTGCRPFDNNATGYTRAEAIVAIILQKQTEAKRIYGSVVHVKTNADGFKSQGITFPSSKGQYALIRDIYHEANIDPKEIGFFEAHGTGTKVGDFAELSVVDAFFKPTVEKPLLIGSVKGNIGHAEPSAALCSIIKTLAAIYFGDIPPNIHYDTPKFGMKALEENRIKVVTETIPFPANKLYAGVNSFGFGGANGHVILGKSKNCTIPAVTKTTNSSLRLICYSGRNPAALDAIHQQIQIFNTTEYLSLLQESFKTDIANHIYRGFTILGSNLQSFSRITHVHKGKVLLILNNNSFETRHFDDLMKMLFLRTAFVEFTNNAYSFQNLDKAIITQLLLLKALKELNSNLEIFEYNEISRAISRYFRNELNLKDVLVQLENEYKTNSTVYNQVIKTFVRNNSKYGSKCTIIMMSSENNMLLNNLNKKYNIVHFGNNLTQETFLYNIGRLHQFGYNQMVHKLYEKVDYPVSCGTNLLSHLLQWNHKQIKAIKTRKHTMFEPERIDLIWTGSRDSSYIRGHIINNTIMYPVTGYLYQVWQLLADQLGYHPNNMNIIFENVCFHRSCIYQEQPIELYLVLHNNGNFEVSQNAITIVTGQIQLCNETEDNDKTESFMDHFHKRNDYVLSNIDVYRELKLRGYNYREQFCAIQTLTPRKSTIKWNGEWVPFLENMIQVAILKADTRNILIPVGIERLVIRARDHMEYLRENQDNLITVNYCENTKSLFSNFINIRGLTTSLLERKKEFAQPVLECYQFIPNEYTTDLATSIRINLQICLETKFTTNFKVLEYVDHHQKSVMSILSKVINETPLIIPDLTIVTSDGSKNVKIAEKIIDHNVLFVCHDVNSDLILKADKALLPDGFLLCFNDSNSYSLSDFPNKFMLLTRHIVSNTRTAYLFRKINPKKEKPSIFDVSDVEELKWMKEVQHAIKISKPTDDIVLYARSNSNNGVLGLTNCIRKEPGNQDKVRCVLIHDDDRTFDINNNKNVDQQLFKQMSINVFRDWQWGTYRHLLLPKLETSAVENWFGKMLNPDDFSSMTWMEKAKTDLDVLTNKVEYSSLHLDLDQTSKKNITELIKRNRMDFESSEACEFAGYNKNGSRVFGLSANRISNIVERSYWTLEVPNSWKLEDAATIPRVYTIALYALKKRARIQNDQSILIHADTSDFALAALNICTYLKCKIFVTVSNKENLDYMKSNYPNAKFNLMEDSNSTSFKVLVMSETNNRGVDIVLCSLKSNKLQASLEYLAYGGVFLYICHNNHSTRNKLQLDFITKECTYHGIMWDEILHDFDQMKEMKNLLCEGIDKGYVKPLPHTVFQMDEVEEALLHLRFGKPIGKVLIKFDIDRMHKVHVVPRFYCDPRRSYIIFGGLGGVGLELADWLILRGAKNIILSSRRGITTEYQKYRIKLWKSYGVKISIISDDVTNYNTCYNLINNINDITPVDGIFNLAVVLNDCLWEHQTLDTMKSSMLPKSILTKHLDTITRKLCQNLRYFVVFSSVTSGRGNAGQSNYGFSNSIMERICESRQIDGLPALAVQWGAIGDVGILERFHKDNNDNITVEGTSQQSVVNCFEVLEEFILQKKPIVSSMVIAEKFDKGIANTPVEVVLRVLGIKDLKTVSLYSPLFEFGLDSIMVVEIKEILQRDFNIKVDSNKLRHLTFAMLEDMSAGKDMTD